MKDAPNCYQCVHRRPIPGDAHSRCNAPFAHVTGEPHGIAHGWFVWPYNFDPTWLVACDAFSDDPADNQPDTKLSPMGELFGLLGKRMVVR